MKKIENFFASLYKNEGINYLYILLVIIAVIPAVWFLVLPGFIKTDDGNWMVIRFSAFYQALRDGQFPVRFLDRLNFGYGYPVSNFLYPGFMYIAIPMKIAGLSFVESIKAVMALSVISSGVFVYLWISKIYGKANAFFASLLYVYAPYHLYDLVGRGSVGELLSLAVAPFILWQVERGSVAWIAIGIGLLIISHNTLAVMFLTLVVLYMGLIAFFAKKQKELVNKFVTAFITGLALSAFFWIPVIFELGSTVFQSINISDWSNYFASLNLIGVTIVSVFVIVPFAFILKRDLYKTNRMAILIYFIGLLSIFIAIPQSTFVWSYLPVSFVQFPFRFLSLTILCASFIFALFLSVLPKKVNILVGILFVAATIYLSSNYLLNPSIDLAPDTFYSTNEATTTVKDEYMPSWVKVKPTMHALDKVVVVNGEGSVANVVSSGRNISFDFSSRFPSIVRVNTIYYPGWSAKANGEDKGIFYDNKYGLMDIKLPDGSYHVNLSFGETPLRFASDLITLGGIIYLVILFLPKRKGSR